MSQERPQPSNPNNHFRKEIPTAYHALEIRGQLLGNLNGCITGAAKIKTKIDFPRRSNRRAKDWGGEKNVKIDKTTMCERLILPREIVYPCITDPDGEDEGDQVSSSLAVSTRWISTAKLLQSDIATLAQGREENKRSWLML
ncbi:hypothetical protein BHE74_00014157 [Ensete ventricosum]|nr:hypothetical protein GW17_00015333 [Ensete ventricosum]RWW77668.1 hypothetical protein BHE74_00014157 [Ensete ventricosum]